MIRKNKFYMKKYNKNRKKANISIQTFFFIMMSIFMIGIIIFGLEKIFFVQDTLTEQDRVLIQKQIKDVVEYCQDPLNKGTIKTVVLENNLFNSVCFFNKTTDIDNIISTAGLDTSTTIDLTNEINTLQDTLNNSFYGAVFIKTTISNSGKLLDYNVIDFIQIDTIIEQSCEFDKKNRGNLNLKIKC